MGWSETVPRGKFIAVQFHFMKQEKSQISNLTLHKRQLEKETIKSVSGRKEIIKIRVEINEIEVKSNSKDEWMKLKAHYLRKHWKWKSLSQGTLCNPMYGIVQGILQARILEWVAFPFSRGSSQPRYRTQVSRVAGIFFTIWATREAQ